MLSLFAGIVLSLTAPRQAPKLIRLDVDGQTREALIFMPARLGPHTPVIFGFHGHGGNSYQASKSFGLQTAWPEAICVYPQGLPTKGGIYDPQGKYNGWAGEPSETNKDIRFFDSLHNAVLTQWGGDRRRVFAMGHSNGGFFMYTLWQMRPDRFAALGSFEAAKGRLNPTVPKPFFVSIGSKDQLVPPMLMRRSLKAIMRLEGSSQQGTPFGSYGTLYPGIQPVALWAYDGNHTFPKDAVPYMVDFFRKY